MPVSLRRTARSSAERQIPVAITGLHRGGLKTAWIEPLWFAPQFIVTVNSINGHIDCRSGADLLVTEPYIAPRGPDDQCRGRIEAHRFLDYLIRINEGVDMAWTNGTTSGSHGNLPPNPALDFRMNAQQI